MSSTKTFSVTKNYMGTINDGGYVNPGDLHMPIGRWDPATGLDWESRAAVYAPVSFSGMTSIVSAHLHLDAHTAAGWHAHGTGGATIYALRKTADWGETTGGASSSVGETWGQHGTSVVASGVASVESGDLVNMDNSPADGTDVAIDITSIVRDWFSGSPNYGLVIMNATSESSASAAKEFYSRHASGHVPYIEVVYETNTAPNAPTGLSPTGNAVSSSNVLKWTHSDPDAGDTAAEAEIYLYDSAGTQINHIVSSSIIGSDHVHGSWGAYPLVSGRRYQWKVRTYDGALWGPFSAVQSFYYEPSQPAPTQSAPASGATITTLTPTFSGTPNLSGDSAMADAQIQVYASNGSTLIWDSGAYADTGSSFSKVYSGPALAWSTTYQWRVRVKTSLGTWSSWSGKRSFTTDSAGGPKNIFPSGTKEGNTTPQIGFTAASGDTIQSWQYEVYEANGTTLHYASPSGLTAGITGGTSVSYTYSGSALLLGKGYQIRFRYTATVGGLGPWSGKASFQMNTPPSAPTLVSPTPGEYIQTLTPTFTWRFSDPDSADWGDTQQDCFVRVFDAGGAMIDEYEGGSALSHTYAGPALAYNTLYQWTVETSDGSQFGAEATHQTFMVVQPPTASGVHVDPTDLDGNGDLSTPTPRVEWTYASPTSLAQAKFQVQVVTNVDGSVAYDTGQQFGTDPFYDLPNGILLNATDYLFRVTVWDTNDVSSTPSDSAVLTTAFAPPAALTGVSTMADPDTSKVSLSWDPSADPNFDHYEVWRRVYLSGGEWDVLASSLDLGQEAYDDYGVALNVTYEYAVVQFAQQGASLVEGAYAPVTSGLSGVLEWYFVAEEREDLTVALTWVSATDESVPIQQQIMEALGRPYKIVLEGQVLGSEGSLTVSIDRSDRALSASIEALLRAQLDRVLIKSPEGDVYAAKLGSIKRQRVDRGGLTLSIDYTQIEDA